jgi:hypothetical protein
LHLGATAACVEHGQHPKDASSSASAWTSEGGEDLAPGDLYPVGETLLVTYRGGAAFVMNLTSQAKLYELFRLGPLKAVSVSVIVLNPLAERIHEALDKYDRQRAERRSSRARRGRRGG